VWIVVNGTKDPLHTLWRSRIDRSVFRLKNALPQFMTKIDGLDIHFIHVRSKIRYSTTLFLSRTATDEPGLAPLEYKGFVFEQPLRLDFLIDEVLILELKAVEEVLLRVQPTLGLKRRPIIGAPPHHFLNSANSGNLAS
jgi:hypothetical protein